MAKQKTNIVEDAPANAMGSSSSSHGAGHVDTFDPLMKTSNNKKSRVLIRFKDLVKNDQRLRKSN